MKTFKLTLEYDGTDFHGWQRQNSRRTVQGDIEAAIRTMTGEAVSLFGSGRTDAGVHALGQVAHFRCDTRLEAATFHKGLNSLLRNDIVVLTCREAPETFHARYDVIDKTYEYHILNRQWPSALHARYAWFIAKSLDTDAMTAACKQLEGRYDFSAFEGAGSPRAHSERTVFESGLSHGDHGLLMFRIRADGFLRYMVRNIIGTLVEIGLGKRTPSDITAILASKDRNQAGPTAPPQGLFLVQVRYKEETHHDPSRQ